MVGGPMLRLSGVLFDRVLSAVQGDTLFAQKRGTGTHNFLTFLNTAAIAYHQL